MFLKTVPLNIDLFHLHYISFCVSVVSAGLSDGVLLYQNMTSHYVDHVCITISLKNLYEASLTDERTFYMLFKFCK